MADIDDTSRQLLELIEHIEIATERHYHDEAERRRIVLAAFCNSSLISGVPGRPDPPVDNDQPMKVLGAACRLKDWAIENVVIPWGIQEVQDAYQELETCRRMAIGSDLEMTFPFEKEPSVDEFNEWRQRFNDELDASGESHLKIGVLVSKTEGKEIRFYHAFIPQLLRQVQMSKLDFAVRAVQAGYFQRSMRGEQCREVLAALKTLRHSVKQYWDHIPTNGEELMNVSHERRAAILPEPLEIKYHLGEAIGAIDRYESSYPADLTDKAMNTKGDSIATTTEAHVTRNDLFDLEQRLHASIGQTIESKVIIPTPAPVGTLKVENSGTDETQGLRQEETAEDPYRSLRDVARDHLTKGRRAFLEKMIEQNGTLALKDFVLLFPKRTSEPDEIHKDACKHINPLIKPLGFEIYRQDNESRLRKLGGGIGE